jgi:hypothetical protein
MRSITRHDLSKWPEKSHKDGALIRDVGVWRVPPETLPARVDEEMAMAFGSSWN